VFTQHLSRDSHVAAVSHQQPPGAIVTYSVCRFPATVTNTEQMPKTMLIPAVVLMAETNDIFIAHSLTLSVLIGSNVGVQ